MKESLDVLEDTREKCEKDFGEVRRVEESRQAAPHFLQVQSAIVITPVIGGGSDAIEDKWYGKTMVHFKDEKVLPFPPSFLPSLLLSLSLPPSLFLSSSSLGRVQGSHVPAWTQGKKISFPPSVYP
eukprot:768407-Hanusia_phi.AAC.3